MYENFLLAYQSPLRKIANHQCTNNEVHYCQYDGGTCGGNLTAKAITPAINAFSIMEPNELVSVEFVFELIRFSLFCVLIVRRLSNL
jgi:hypothetical protein